MSYLLKVLFFGLLGGVLGGMGMGGGTALIPLLTIFTNITQKSAQAINLISFIPMAIVALFLHVKNGLVNKKVLPYFIIPSCVFAVLGSVVCIVVDVTILRRVFGGFLIALSVLQFFVDKLLIKIKNNQ